MVESQSRKSQNVQVDSWGKAYRKDDVWALSAVRPKLILSNTMEGTCFVVCSSQFKLS